MTGKRKSAPERIEKRIFSVSMPRILSISSVQQWITTEQKWQCLRFHFAFTSIQHDCFLLSSKLFDTIPCHHRLVTESSLSDGHRFTGAHRNKTEKVKIGSFEKKNCTSKNDDAAGNSHNKKKKYWIKLKSECSMKERERRERKNYWKYIAKTIDVNDALPICYFNAFLFFIWETL